MFSRILIPLDGSKRAERALSVGARIARASHGSIVLAQVVGIPAEYSMYGYGSFTVQTPSMTEDMIELEETNARAYLEIIGQSETLKDIPTETKILVGNAAAALEELAEEEKVDLIVMCSHGDTGFKRWLIGSVAQKVSRRSHIPVLILHQEGSRPDTAFPDHLHPLRTITAMVALDGSPFAEAAIEPTAHLVAALSAPARGTLLLTMVVPTHGQQPGASTTALDEAKAYLRDVVQAHRSMAEQVGVTLDTSVAARKDVAEALIRAAEYGEEALGKRLTGGCDLIAVTTHGRGGLERLAMGSVTERMLGATKLPLFVVHNAP